MGATRLRQALVRGVVVACAGAALFDAGAAAASSTHRRPRPKPPAPAIVSVGSWTPSRPIPSGFLGVSLEYNTVAAYEGDPPGGGDPVLAQLIRNLAPGQAPILRIGGDSTDWTWWPISGMHPVRGVNNALTPQWLQKARTLALMTGARVILGINLEADSTRIASVEARELVAGIGRSHVAALEIGNEPMLYPQLPWYRLPSGKKAFGRPWSYTLADYTGEFSRIARVLPDEPLAGPAIGHSWLPQLPEFIRSAPRLRIVTFHGYAVNSFGDAFRGRNCSTALSAPAHPSVSTLLAPIASAGLTRNVEPDILLAHSRGLRFRMDEINAITCAGTPGVSDTFASALWALNTLFSIAQAGVDGVNFHTWRGSAGRLFSFGLADGQWTGEVRPEYYGLLTFARAAPRGARLLPAVATNAGSLEPWATIAPDRHIRVVLINRSLSRSERVILRIPVARGPAQVEALQAPGVSATAGVTLGGQTFGDATTTGLLGGAQQITTMVVRRAGLALRVPPASALLVTVATRR